MRCLRYLSWMLLCLFACNTAEEKVFDQSAWLEALADQQVVISYAALEKTTTQLEKSCTKFQLDPSILTLTELQERWKAVASAWMACDLFILGPVQDNFYTPYFYTRPVRAEKIDELIEEEKVTSIQSVPNIPASTQGIAAIEYLIFPQTENEGKEDVLLKFTEGENSVHRMIYLLSLASYLESLAIRVLDEWVGNEGYRFTFAKNTGTSVSGSLSKLVNRLLSQLDLLKAEQLGIPLGKYTVSDFDLTKLPAYASEHSKGLAVANFQACHRLLVGPATDKSLMAQLSVLGKDDLRAEIETIVDELANALPGSPAPWETTIQPNSPEFENIFNKVDALFGLLKGDMVTALGIQLTFSDNDGD